MNKFGHYIPFLFVGTALMTIGAGTLYTLQPDTGLSQWVGLQFLAGFGPGMSFSELQRDCAERKLVSSQCLTILSFALRLPLH